ncbi:hypothetical protein BDR07DRAFT_1448069 [Suillus spraguei]|nr:hypothetical protein BDR07DRAFT_1448069 [Suillus spraguei]
MCAQTKRVLQQFSFKLINLTTLLLPAWKEALKELKLPVKYMPQDVATCWNSTFNMLNFGLQYQAAIDVMTDKRKLGLGEYELSEEEWTLVKPLWDVLKVLKDATLYFSRATPNLAMVIPAMDHIDAMFTSGLIQKDLLNPAIQSVIQFAKRTLNRYYSCTDKSATGAVSLANVTDHMWHKSK